MASETREDAGSTWTYPTRSCRLCHEEVVPTVTVSNPSLPAPFRTTTIAYISEEGGKLIKPCKCKGTQRYIHEDCLAELRAKSPQKNAYLKCDLCRFEYNTKRLLVHDILLSRVARMMLTILLVAVLMFVLGFVADPIINLYVDPVRTLTERHYWDPVELDNIGEKTEDSWWIQHFMKGLVSVGVMGFFKAVLLANPWQFWNLRHYGLLGGSTRTTTGRDRAVNISWIAVVIGVGSALYFFYQQVAKFSQSTLSKFANKVIEVQMDDDDDDLRILPSANGSVRKAAPSTNSAREDASTVESAAHLDRDVLQGAKIEDFRNPGSDLIPTIPNTLSPQLHGDQLPDTSSNAEKIPDPVGWSSALLDARAPRWSSKSVGK
jgi:hypothetical protein